MGGVLTNFFITPNSSWGWVGLWQKVKNSVICGPFILPATSKGSKRICSDKLWNQTLRELLAWFVCPTSSPTRFIYYYVTANNGWFWVFFSSLFFFNFCWLKKCWPAKHLIPGPFTAKDAPEQSDLDAKQERDEAVRTCVARLCGLANICALSKKCTKVACTQDVSYMEPSILLALVKGLY